MTDISELLDSQVADSEVIDGQASAAQRETTIVEEAEEPGLHSPSADEEPSPEHLPSSTMGTLEAGGDAPGPTSLPRVFETAEPSETTAESVSAAAMATPSFTETPVGVSVEATDDSAIDGPAETPMEEALCSAEDLLELRQALELRLESLAEAFETRLAIDEHKNRQIDILHSELQQHKQDLLAKALRPLLSGLVRLHGDLGRTATELRGQAEALSPSEASVLVDEFRDDVEILLEENGVLVLHEPVDRFDPRRQTARRVLDTDDPEQVGRIAHRARPGFERDGVLLQKERVDVYAARAIPPDSYAEE